MVIAYQKIRNSIRINVTYADIFTFVKYRNVIIRAVYTQKQGRYSLYTVFMTSPKILFHNIVAPLVGHLKTPTGIPLVQSVLRQLTSKKMRQFCQAHKMRLQIQFCKHISKVLVKSYQKMCSNSFRYVLLENESFRADTDNMRLYCLAESSEGNWKFW